MTARCAFDANAPLHRASMALWYASETGSSTLRRQYLAEAADRLRDAGMPERAAAVEDMIDWAESCGRELDAVFAELHAMR